MDLPSAAGASPPPYGKAVDAYKKAVATVASVTAYTVLVRSVARELLPHELRAAFSWAASLAHTSLEPRPAECRTVVVRRHDDDRRFGREDGFYVDVREYLATRIDPRSMWRLFLGGSRKVTSIEHSDSMTDVFEGVQFMWASVAGKGRHGTESLALSFDAEHTDMALGRYAPFITTTVEQARHRERVHSIFMNENTSRHGITHHHCGAPNHY